MNKLRKIVYLLFLINLLGFAQENIWEQAGGFNSGEVWALATDSSGRIYASAGSLLYRSTDLGNTWNLIGDFLNVGVFIYDIEINNEGYVFIGTTGVYGAFRSTDDGKTWQELYNGLFPSVRELSISPNGYIIAGTDIGVYLSTNNGDEWTDIWEGMPDWMISSVLATYENEIFAATEGMGIYSSTDWGLNWEEKNNGLITWFIIEIVEGKDSTLYAGADDAGILFISTNDGNNWVAHDQGIPPPANIFSIIPKDPARIFISGVDMGVYYSFDEGITWNEFNAGLSNEVVLSMTNTKENFLFAGTYGGGVFRTIQPVTSVNNKENENPVEFYLYQNYPNPFNPSTTIKYQLSNSGIITLKVYDILGRLVTTLINEFKSAGSYEKNFNSEELSSGVYIYRITVTNNGRILFTDANKMIFLR